MPTREELESSLIQADQAGDSASAQVLADEIRKFDRPASFSGGRPPPSAAGDAMELVRSGARGLVKGTVGLPGTLANIIPEEARGERAKFLSQYSGDKLIEMMKERGLDLTDPPRTPGSGKAYLNSAAEFAGGMAAGPASSIIPRIATGAAAGAAGEAGRQIHPMGGTVAEMLALLLPGYKAAKTPNAVKAVQKDLEEFSPTELTAAKVKADKTSAVTGEPTLLTQGLDRPSAMEAVVENLTQSKQGGRLRKLFGDQLAGAMTPGRKMIEDLSPLPADQSTANRVGSAMKKAESAPREEFASRVSPFEWAAGKKELEPGMADLISIVLKQRADSKDLALKSDSGQHYVKAAKKIASVEDERKSLMKVEDIGRSAGGDVYDIVKSVLGNEGAYQGLTRARKAFEGPVKEMEGSQLPGLVQKGEGTDWSKLTKALTDPNIGVDQIHFIGKHLARQDPEAFAAVVKKSWTDKLEKAMESKDGRVPQEASGVFALEVGGTAGSTQRQKALAAIEQVWAAKGVNPKEVVGQVGDILDAMQVVSRGRGGIGKVDMREVERAAAENPGSAVLRTPTLVTGGSPMAATLDRMVAGRTYNKLIDALLDPEAAKKLSEIARFAPAAQKGKAILTALQGMSGQNFGMPE